MVWNTINSSDCSNSVALKITTLNRRLTILMQTLSGCFNSSYTHIFNHFVCQLAIYNCVAVWYLLNNVTYLSQKPQVHTIEIIPILIKSIGFFYERLLE